ncbi:MAG: hypothetical protein ABI142_13835, partial [Bryocella sp.]
NDVLQFVLLMGGNLIFGLILVHHAGGMHAVWIKVAASRGDQFLSALPSGSGLSLMTIVALCVQGLFFAGSPFAGEGWTAQRFMAAKNERHAVLGQIANGVLALVVRLIPFIVIALAAAAFVLPSQVPVPAALWGDLVRRYAPTGLLGLLLVSSLAGYMAAISSIGNWAASYLVNDIYSRRMKPDATRKQVMRASRVATGGLLCVAFILGAAIHADQLDKWILFINSSLIVFSLPLAWLKWFWWRTNASADMAGVLGGFPAGYLVWFGSDGCLPASLRHWLGHVTGWNWNGIVPAFSDLNRFPFWMGFGLLFVSGFIVIVGTALLTKPEPIETLTAFYRCVKPMGFWKPVTSKLSVAVRPSSAGEIGTAAIGVVFYFALTVALFEGMGGHGKSCLLILLIAVVAGYAFYRLSMSRVQLSDDDTAVCDEESIGTS